MAAPRNLKDGATVIKWNADFTYQTLRKGANKLVCYDRSGQPGQQPFAIECTSIANLPRAAQNLKLEAIPDKKASLAAFDAAEKDGSRVKPEFGSTWYHFNGIDADQRTPISPSLFREPRASRSDCRRTASRAACGS
jgi:hypothetical protein